MAKIISISGEIGWDVWPEDIRNQINAAKGEDIEFQISSPGGYISDGLEIFNLIHDYQGKTTARIIGMAASMASYIPLAADRVIAKSNAVYMIHNALMGVYGNQQDHRDAADILEGLSNLIADIYVKKTGKSFEEIQALMAKDSYFFGSAILDAGFVDEMEEIEVGENNDKEKAFLDTKAKVKLCVEKVLAKPEKISRAAALLPEAGSEKIETTSKPEQRESANSNNSHNGKIMPFEDFLKENPQFKAEIDSALALEKTAGKTEAKEEFDAKVAKVATIIESDAYNAKIKALAIKALKGEISAESLDVVIAMHDTTEESNASDAAAGEQPEDTPADDTVLSTDGSLRNEADIQAYIARKKGGK